MPTEVEAGAAGWARSRTGAGRVNAPRGADTLSLHPHGQSTQPDEPPSSSSRRTGYHLTSTKQIGMHTVSWLSHHSCCSGAPNASKDAPPNRRYATASLRFLIPAVHLLVAENTQVPAHTYPRYGSNQAQMDASPEYLPAQSAYATEAERLAGFNGSTPPCAYADHSSKGRIETQPYSSTWGLGHHPFLHHQASQQRIKPTARILQTEKV